MRKAKTKSRIYVCHTFYHVYVAALKEMKLVRETPANAYKKAEKQAYNDSACIP